MHPVRADGSDRVFYSRTLRYQDGTASRRCARHVRHCAQRVEVILLRNLCSIRFFFMTRLPG